MVQLRAVVYLLAAALNFMYLINIFFTVKAGLAGVAMVLYWNVAEVFFRQKGAASNVNAGGSDSKSSIILLILFAGSSIFLNYFVITYGIEEVTDSSDCVSFCVMGLAASLRWISMFVLRDSFTRTLQIQANQKLVTEGPYYFVRHPGYCANILFYAAYTWTVTHYVPALMFIIVLFFAGYYYRTSAEEQMLEEHFGKEYQDYKQKTRWRLFPLLF